MNVNNKTPNKMSTKPHTINHVVPQRGRKSSDAHTLTNTQLLVNVHPPVSWFTHHTNNDNNNNKQTKKLSR